MLLRFGSILFAVPGIILLVLYGIELSAATECQQMGLFYNAITGICEETQPVFSTFYLRHTLLVNSMLLVAVVGTVMMTLGMIKKQR